MVWPVALRLRSADAGCALLLAGMTVGLRLWPLLYEPWIKPDYDEGVYLGGAWLLRQAVLPYRDVVFAHLPGALVMLLPAAHLIEVGHSNDAALLMARATVACANGMTAGLIYVTMRQLVAPVGALLAAVVYASDALLMQHSRSVLLEPLQAPWIVAGMGLVLATMNGRRLGMLAGLCLAFGVAIKLSGAVAPIAALLIVLAGRQWTNARDLGIGLLAGATLTCGWCVLTSGSEIVRQAVLLQLQRPSVRPWDYWNWLLGDRWMAFTATTAFLGMLALTGRAWLNYGLARGWLVLLLWLALTLLLFAVIGDFYDHYYTALVAPLACLAAAFPGTVPKRYRRWTILITGFLLGPLWWAQGQPWHDVDRAPTVRPTVDGILAMPGEQPVLAFNPLINVLAGRPFAQVPGGPYLLDSFLGETYLDSALDRRWPDAQSAKIAAAGSAEYLVGSRKEMDFLPTLHRSFTWRMLDPAAESLLFIRVDQPDTLVTVGDQLELLRREGGRVERQVEQTWLVQPLHWRSPTTPSSDIALALHLFDSKGIRVGQVDVPVNGGTDWMPGSITTLEYRMPLPADLAPGSYRLEARVYSWNTGMVMPMRVGRSPNEQDSLALPVVVAP